MYRISHVLRIVIFSLYFALPLDASAADSDYVIPVAPNEIKIMSYNVENLFDAVHDQDKNDYEFLPANDPEKENCKKKKSGAENCLKLDWTKKKVEMKLMQTKEALAAQGELPDILSLIEVENPSVVKQLAQVLGYDTLLMTNSPDARGIDCAILYKKTKLKLVEYVEKEVENALFPTRNLSVAIFQLSKKMGGGLIAYSPNHWPSQGNTGPARMLVAKAAVNLFQGVLTKYPEAKLIVTGDFNTLANEKPNALDDVLLSKDSKLELRDVHQMAKEENKLLPDMPKATYFYGANNEWNEFDHIYVSSDLNDQKDLDVVTESFRIHAPSFMTKTNKFGEAIPFRYSHEATAKNLLGYSDHFGILVKLRYQ